MLECELKKHIKKVSFDFKKGKDLEFALKSKLTKKEFKLLKAMAEDRVDELKNKLKLDENAFEELKRKLIKKLNSEKTKQVIYKY